MSARTTSRKLPRWQVYMIRGARGSFLGVIAAADEVEAVTVACTTFFVEPADRRRIMVQLVADA